jgi:hypothetical protein
VIIGEGEGEVGVEPAVVGVAAIGGFAEDNHDFSRLSGWLVRRWRLREAGNVDASRLP